MASANYDTIDADAYAYFLGNRPPTIDPRGPDNPLFHRLTQVHGTRFDSISLRQSRLLGLGLAIVSLIFACVAFLNNWGILLRFSLILTVPIVVFFPFFSYIITMVMVSSDTRSETYDLLYMSDLSNEAITWGYFRAALYRLRIFYILVIAMMPLMVIGMLYQHVYAIAEHHVYYLPPCGIAPTQPSPAFGTSNFFYPSVPCAEEPITNNEKTSIISISVVLWMQIVFFASAAPLTAAYAISLTLRRRHLYLGGLMGGLMVLALLFVPLSAFGLVFYGIRAKTGISQLALVLAVFLAVIGLFFPPLQRYYSSQVVNHASRRARAQLE
jgi:hypothetical protein